MVRQHPADEVTDHRSPTSPTRYSKIQTIVNQTLQDNFLAWSIQTSLNQLGNPFHLNIQITKVK
jgi:hypothetical protein